MGAYSSNVTVPVGLVAPTRVASARTGVPSGAVAGTAVAFKVGRNATVRVWLASPQLPETAALLASPLYEATQWWAPIAAVVYSADRACDETTGMVEVKIGVPVQLASLGAYRSKVMVPVGLP